MLVGCEHPQRSPLWRGGPGTCGGVLWVLNERILRGRVAPVEVTVQGNIMEDGHVDCVVRNPEGVECREWTIGQVAEIRLSPHSTQILQLGSFVALRSRITMWPYINTTWTAGGESGWSELHWVAWSLLLPCQPLEREACLPCHAGYGMSAVLWSLCLLSASPLTSCLPWVQQIVRYRQ